MQLPVFLENTPGVICDQILFLVKNSNLDFQLKETPFSLNLSVKKRFSNHWNWNQGCASRQNIHVVPASPYSQPPPQHPHHNPPQQRNPSSNWNLPHNVHHEGPLNPHRNAQVPSQHQQDQLVHQHTQQEATYTPPGTPPRVSDRQPARTENPDYLASNENLKGNYDNFEKKLLGCRAENETLAEFKTKKNVEEKKVEKKEKKKLQKQKKVVIGNMLEHESFKPVDEEKIIVSNIPVKNLFSCLENEVGEDTTELKPTNELEPELKSNSLQDENANETTHSEVKDNLEERDNVGLKVDDSLDSDREDWESFEEDPIECFCGETFLDEDGIIFHRRTEHPDLSYNCKLCDVKLLSEDDHVQHRIGDHHRNLSLQVKQEFEKQLSSKCDECRISEIKSDTNYYVCENDGHVGTFNHIWNQVKGRSKAE